MRKDTDPFGKTNTDGITFDGLVNVGGLDLSESWQYRTSSTGLWVTGTGSSFILGEAVYAAGSIQVRKTLATDTVVTNSSLIKVDITPPAALTLALAQDTGSSAIDSITKNVVVNVSGLEDGATWEYSLGGRWIRGSGTSFNLSNGTYAAGVIKARQYDVAGNVQTTLSSTEAITVDTRAPNLVTYTLSGTDAARFTINAANGQVKFAAVPDYEAPLAAGGGNVYNINVIATDVDNNTATKNVAISVTAVSDGIVTGTLDSFFDRGKDKDSHSCLEHALSGQ